MVIRVNSRVDRLTDYPFSRLRQLLDGLSPPADIEPLIVSIGEPRQSPGQIARSVEAHHADWWRYPSLDGTERFRQAVEGWCRRRFGITAAFLATPRSILPVAGTREALFLFAQTVVPEPTWERGLQRPLVVVPNPYYAGYPGAAIMAGAEPLFLGGAGRRNSLPDLTSLSSETLDRVVLAYICAPSNPIGEAATLEYLIETIRIARRHDIVLAIDECAVDLYHGAPVPGSLQACEAIGDGLDNVVVFQSLSKRSSAAGLRSGAVIGDPGLLQRFWEVRCFGGATLPVPVLAASTDLWHDDTHVAETRAEIGARFDVAERLLSGRFDFYRPDAGFFLWLNVGDGEAAARRLWQNAGLQVMPGAYLARDTGHGNPCQAFIRIALVHELPVIESALRRLTEAL
ncbi:MAG: aminotransferase class I/II-fold pyridoxal phosphate-dependent enzyme [Azospirillaceae bacterium]|nr:aminotransferase class I/II-fold pyridoxal phosphate-dependent enzyme [Azospirillaceae bacterium]